MNKKLIHPSINVFILGLALFTGVAKDFLMPVASKAQNYPSFAQTIVAAENKYTFNKKEVTTWRDETGTKQREVRHYNNSWQGREFIVVAVYEDLQGSSDINVSGCEYYDP